jgi:predicted nucleic acid-binding Zn ribbon protein
MQESLDFQKIKNNWNEFLTTTFSNGWRDKTEPTMLKNKVLHIRCANSVWGSELRLKQEFLFSQIKKKFKTIKIEKIRFYS